MSRYVHPFETGIRVMLVRMPDSHQPQPGFGRFGVSMRGGRYVVPLPREYDGRTEVRWVQGWILVTHPDEPPLLADTTTGKTGPMNEHALAAAMHEYVAPTVRALH